jgi:chemotaxis protein CheX
MPLKDDVALALVGSVKEAFKTMLSTELVESDQVHEKVMGAELICSIGLTGKMEGSLVISLPAPAACVIVSRMLQMELTEISPDVCDGMGEVANVVAGGVKMRMAALDLSFNVSIPTVVQGGMMHVNAANDLEMTVKHFEAEGFCFDVELAYKVAAVAAADPKVAVAASKMSAFEKLKAMTAKAQ